MRADDFVNPKSKIDYDIIDDIHAFMTNDNDFYRRNYFPVVWMNLKLKEKQIKCCQ